MIALFIVSPNIIPIIVSMNAIRKQIIQEVRHRILYTNINSNISKAPLITSCQNLLGSDTLSKSAVNHNPPQSLTIAQKSITTTIKISKNNENICSPVLSLKYSLIRFIYCFYL